MSDLTSYNIQDIKDGSVTVPVTRGSKNEGIFHEIRQLAYENIESGQACVLGDLVKLCHEKLEIPTKYKHNYVRNAMSGDLSLLRVEGKPVMVARA